MGTIRLSKIEKYTRANLVVQSANSGRTEDIRIPDPSLVQSLIPHIPPGNQIKT